MSNNYMPHENTRQKLNTRLGNASTKIWTTMRTNYGKI